MPKQITFKNGRGEVFVSQDGGRSFKKKLLNKVKRKGKKLARKALKIKRDKVISKGITNLGEIVSSKGFGCNCKPIRRKINGRQMVSMDGGNIFKDIGKAFKKIPKEAKKVAKKAKKIAKAGKVISRGLAAATSVAPEFAPLFLPLSGLASSKGFGRRGVTRSYGGLITSK
jgi:hypothetical protein